MRRFTTILKNPVATASYTDTKSVSFDGVNDQGLMAGSTFNSVFPHNSAWSISLWFYLNNLSGEKTFISTRDPAAGYKGILFEPIGSDILFQLNSATQGGGVRKTCLTANTWYQAVVTYDGSQNTTGMILYLNATSLGSGLNVAITSSTVTSLQAQVGYEISYDYLNGKMGDMATYNRVLTSTEVTEIYNGGHGVNLLATSVAGTVTHWHQMGDGVGDGGSTVKDQIGSAHITLSNGASIVTAAP